MLFYTNDIAIFIGKLNPVSHEHNALEIAIGVGAPLTLKLQGGKSVSGNAFLILPNQKHQVLINPLIGEKVTIDIDAELNLARLLVHKIKSQNEVFYILESDLVADFSNKVKTLKAEAIKDNGACIYKEVQILLEKQFTTLYNLQLPEIDNRVQHIIKHIKQNVKKQTFSFKELAEEVGLSEGRLAHLFTTEIGIPFRKYVLWIRLKTAVVQVLNGESITQASLIAGFSDSSHFSNVYFKMFGLKPSAPLKDI